jgi:hypothetical protein
LGARALCALSAARIGRETPGERVERSISTKGVVYLERRKSMILMKKEVLEDTYGLPYEGQSGAKILQDSIIDHSRWSVIHQLLFTLPDLAPGEAYQAIYSVGATEYQDESPWEYLTDVEVWKVRQVEKLVKVWEEVPE